MYTAIAIAVVFLIIAIFFVSYVANKRTPVPKGCEDIVADTGKCMSCGNSMCRFSGSKEE